MAGYPNNQGNPAGAIPVYIAAVSGGGSSFVNIPSSGNTQVKTGAGTLFGVSVNTGGAGSAVTLYDGTDNTGPKIGTYSTAAQGGPVLPISGIAFTTGLYAVTAGGTPADLTISYI